VANERPEVLVVHCVDTEGPLGGDARRWPDGSAEFFDNWDEIVASLAELTQNDFRFAHADSFAAPYVFNWFILDFTGFRTNPKFRVAAYHDTYDHLKALPTQLDGFYWHYHAPPASGIGDHWPESWLESNEHNTILSRRLLERSDFPVAFRAGGTIEDNAASRWLEEVFPLDFSNRVSERSYPGADLYHFNWYGAPAVWGSYHPAYNDFLQPGSMRRLIYRSIDLESRYNVLGEQEIEACFREVDSSGITRVLSYFTHDTRDMRPETYRVSEQLRAASERTGVPWRSCTAVEAHRRFHGLGDEPIHLSVEVENGEIVIESDTPPFQRIPFAAAELADGRFVRLYSEPLAPTRWVLRTDLEQLVRFGAGVTSASGSKSVCVGSIVGREFVETPNE
jgi:hypothetical protein